MDSWSWPHWPLLKHQMASSDFLVLPVAMPQTLISCGCERGSFSSSDSLFPAVWPVLGPVWRRAPRPCSACRLLWWLVVTSHAPAHARCARVSPVPGSAGSWALGPVAIFSPAATLTSACADGIEPFPSPGKQNSSHVTGISYHLCFLHSPSSPAHLWSHSESYTLSGSNPIRQLVNWLGESLLLPCLGWCMDHLPGSWALSALVNWGCVGILRVPCLACFTLHNFLLSVCGDWPLIT